MYLMLCDIKVLWFDFDKFGFEIIDNLKLPFGLRGRFTEKEDLESVGVNFSILRNWLFERVRSDLTKPLCDYFGLYYYCGNSKDEIINCCIKYHALSMLDSYWVCEDSEILFYQDIHPRVVGFKSIENYMYSHKSVDGMCNDNSPELCNSLGVGYVWTKDELLSLGVSNYLVSEILKIMELNFDFVDFDKSSVSTVKGNTVVSKCDIFLGNDESFIKFDEILAFCEASGVKMTDLLPDFDEFLASINVLDFLLSNDGRTNKNFGCIMDNQTGKLKGFAPIFGFERAFKSQVSAEILKESADLVNIKIKSFDSLNKLGVNIDKLKRNYEIYLSYKTK